MAEGDFPQEIEFTKEDACRSYISPNRQRGFPGHDEAP
jgi:hypothetical protein